MRRRQDQDPEKRREREFDAITFVLAGVLSAIVLGAIGYGIFNSSQGRTAIPPLTAGPRSFGPPPTPSSTTGLRRTDNTFRSWYASHRPQPTSAPLDKFPP